MEKQPATLLRVRFGDLSQLQNHLHVVDGRTVFFFREVAPRLQGADRVVLEFSVATSGSAEMGRNGGGVVNMVMKSGTNELHGSAFYYNRNEYFAANTPLTAGGAVRRIRNAQGGFSAGGPIVKNRAFFFGAAEFINERKSLAVQDAQFQQMALLVPFGVEPTRQIPQPFNDKLATFNVYVPSGHRKFREAHTPQC